MNLISEIEREHMAELTAEKSVPDFQPGDTVKVNVVIEGSRERVQAFEGVCIARAGGGLNENFTVRKFPMAKVLSASFRSIHLWSTRLSWFVGAVFVAPSSTICVVDW